jgi:ABC-2 type transport system permease protein
MMLRVLWAKEIRLLWRDPYALGLLFVMPVVFVLIMSLSLQQVFSDKRSPTATAGLPVLLYFDSAMPSAWQSRLAQLAGFEVRVLTASADRAVARNAVRLGESVALIEFPPSLAAAMRAGTPWQEPISVTFSPSAPGYVQGLLEASLMRVLAELQFSLSQAQAFPGMGMSASISQLWGDAPLHKTTLSAGEDWLMPSAVQQSVPAWLVFAMFFIVIPMALTLLVEINQGTLARLHTFPLPLWRVLLGKLVPYLGVNVIQALLMFASGMWLVPLLGGEALQLNQQAWLLIPTVVSVSVAAMGFALLIAVSVSTHEQASTLGGLSNLVMGALGGVMVPVFVMPPMMQTLAGFSPMNWGLEALLTVLLRGGDVSVLWPDWLRLWLLALSLFALAWWILRRRLARQG